MRLVRWAGASPDAAPNSKHLRGCPVQAAGGPDNASLDQNLSIAWRVARVALLLSKIFHSGVSFKRALASLREGFRNPIEKTCTTRGCNQYLYHSFMHRTANWLCPLSSLLLGVVALLLFPACNAINPLCGSARPAPTISALSPATMQFSQVQQGAVLTVNGSNFVSASVVVINGTALATTVVSDQQLQVTITTQLIPAAGTANVSVNTPSGNSGNLGCESGGTSGTLVLTVS